MKLKPNLTIANRISVGYVIIILVGLVTSLASIFTLRDNRKIDNEITSTHLPSVTLLKELSLLVTESKKLTNNWIFLSNKEEKARLAELHSKDYPELKEKLVYIKASWTDEGEKSLIQHTFEDIDQVITFQKQIMNTLDSEEGYSDDAKVDAAITTYEKALLPTTDKGIGGISNLLQRKNDYLEQVQEQKNNSYTFLSAILITMLLLMISVGTTASIVTTRSIVKPLNGLKEVIAALGKGEIVQLKVSETNDEIGEMTKAIAAMLNGIKVKSDFATEIGKGNYNIEFTLLSEKDEMGEALIEMRDNLKTNAEEERKRTWSTTGLAQIGDILRKNYDKSEDFYTNTLAFLVKYLQANQGALFIIQEDHKKYLEQVACYAYNKRKYTSQRIEIGEGLVGQCVLENDTIYVTDVPDHYVSITSGLGEANPRSVLIVPLKLNNAVHGVIELASFVALEPNQVAFVEKIAETIASSISTIKINDRTRKLLEESQIQAENLRAQEEEMRQNMEELAATQEEMQRKEREYLAQLEFYQQNVELLESKTTNPTTELKVPVRSQAY
jgi:HAMP domain-containing protein